MKDLSTPYRDSDGRLITCTKLINLNPVEQVEAVYMGRNNYSEDDGYLWLTKLSDGYYYLVLNTEDEIKAVFDLRKDLHLGDLSLSLNEHAYDHRSEIDTTL